MAEPMKKVATEALKVKVTTNAEERTVTAVVSTSSLDRDYERVDVQSLRLPLKGGGSIMARDLTGDELVDIPMLIDHDFSVENVIGSVRKAYLNALGELEVVFGISKRAKAQDLITLLEEGHLVNAFSITMNDYDFDGETIYNAEIVEISLVFRGSNKDARLLAVKSLLNNKESEMSKGTEQTVAEQRAELQAKLAELDKAEAAENKAVYVDGERVGGADAKVEAPAKEEPKAEVKTEEPEEKTTTKPSKKDITKMSEANEVATKQVITPAVSDIEQPVVKTKKVSKKEVRELYVKQMHAFMSKDRTALAELNKKAMELSGAKSKAIGFDDGAAIFQSEIVSADIRDAYSNVGRVGALVNRINISGAEKWSQIQQTAGDGFQPVGVEEAKQEDAPVWTKLGIEPKEHAMIVAWFDGMAKRTPLAVYDQIVKYIAREYAKLEDKIILSFAGVTTAGGDVFAATGLVPLLTADTTRVINVDAGYAAADIQAALGAAYGLVESDETITLVANRKTWGKLATVVDVNGKNVFTVVGDQVSAGALGTFNVVLSQSVADDRVVVGAYGDYTLVTNEGLETLFSREATVGSLNLYVSDASAVRANVEIAGKPVSLKSFALMVLDYVATP